MTLALSLVGGIALTIEAAGSVLLLGYVVAALLALARQRGLEHCRLLLADDAVFSLGFKTAASLLKTLELNTWHQIGAFVAVLALRTVLKRAFAAEKVSLARSASSAGSETGHCVCTPDGIPVREHCLNVLKKEVPSKCQSRLCAFPPGLSAMPACRLLCSQAVVRSGPTSNNEEFRAWP